jgi:hypothetical protein
VALDPDANGGGRLLNDAMTLDDNPGPCEPFLPTLSVADLVVFGEQTESLQGGGERSVLRAARMTPPPRCKAL